MAAKKIPFSPRQLGGEKMKIYRMEPVRSAWRLQTNQGQFSLKKTFLPPEQLTFFTQGTAYLRQNGFLKINEYMLFPTGEYFLPDGAAHWLMTRWIQGRESNMRDPEQVYQAAMSMAQMHTASRGFKSPVSLENISHLGYLEKDFEKYAGEIRGFAAAAGKLLGPLADLILRYNDLFHRQALEACRLLKEFNYPSFLHSASDQVSLIHQDFIFHNLIWRFGEIHLIDPDYMSYDLPCIDLGKFLRRNMLNSDWSLNGAENILTGYSGISPLGKEEMQLLYILLSLPYKYWQTIYLFLTGKPGHTYRRTLKTVEQLVNQIPRKALFLEQFADQFL